MPTPNFLTQVTNPFGLTSVGGVSVGGAVSPSCVDLDGDGDLDIIVSKDTTTFIYFENTGTATAPAYTFPTTNPFGLTAIGASGVYSSGGDLNNDGDLDILVAAGNVGAYDYFENTGNSTTPFFAAAQVNPFGLAGTGAGFNFISFTDFDNDGDLDVLSISQTTPNFRYSENTGNSTTPSFAAAVGNPFGLTDSFTAPVGSAVGDLDSDGDADVLMNIASGDFKYYENFGTAVTPIFGLVTINPYGLSNLGVGPDGLGDCTMADIDGDGTLDILCGLTTSGNFVFFGRIPLTSTASQTPSFTLTVSETATPSSSATLSNSVTLSTSTTPSFTPTVSETATPSISIIPIASVPSVLLSNSLNPSSSVSNCATAVIEKVTNELTIKDGQTVVYTSKILQADLPGCTPDEIKYTVEQASHGQFERTKGKLAVRDKNAITSFTQADVDAGAISFEHDGSNQKPSYTLGITNGVVSKNDKGDIKFIPRAQQSKSHRTERPTSRPNTEDSAASRLSGISDVSSSFMLGIVLAKMGSSAIDSLILAGQRWWQDKVTIANAVSVAEHKQAQASFTKLEARISHLLSQKDIDKWYCHSLEDMQDELASVKRGSLSLAQVKEWQAELGELEADYAPVNARTTIAASKQAYSNSFFKSQQSIIMPEQAVLPRAGVCQRIAA